MSKDYQVSSWELTWLLIFFGFCMASDFLTTAIITMGSLFCRPIPQFLLPVFFFSSLNINIRKSNESPINLCSPYNCLHVPLPWHTLFGQLNFDHVHMHFLNHYLILPKVTVNLHVNPQFHLLNLNIHPH